MSLQLDNESFSQELEGTFQQNPDDMDFEVDKEWCEGYKDVWTDPKDSSASYIQSLHKNFPRSIASKYVKAVGYPKAYKVGDHETIKKIFI